MATSTTFLGLNKPSGGEYIDVLTLNDNWDKLDKSLDSLSAQDTRVELYVTKTGSDLTGNGTVSKPYKTIKCAISKLKKKTFANVEIRVGKGDYTDEGSINLLGFEGSQFVLQAFDGTNVVMSVSTDYKVNTILVRDCGAIYINGFNTHPTAGYGIFTDNVRFAKYTGISCSMPGLTVGGFGCTTYSFVWLKDCSCSNLATVISANVGAKVVSENFINSTGNLVGITSNTGATVHLFDDNQPIGDTMYSQSGGSTCFDKHGVVIPKAKTVSLDSVTKDLSSSANIVIPIDLPDAPKFITVEASREMKSARSTGYTDVVSGKKYCNFTMEDGKTALWEYAAVIFDGPNNVAYNVINTSKTSITLKPTIVGSMTGNVNIIVKTEC